MIHGLIGVIVSEIAIETAIGTGGVIEMIVAILEISESRETNGTFEICGETTGVMIIVTIGDVTIDGWTSDSIAAVNAAPRSRRSKRR